MDRDQDQEIDLKHVKSGIVYQKDGNTSFTYNGNEVMPLLNNYAESGELMLVDPLRENFVAKLCLW